MATGPVDTTSNIGIHRKEPSGRKRTMYTNVCTLEVSRRIAVPVTGTNTRDARLPRKSEIGQASGSKPNDPPHRSKAAPLSNEFS
jgi:hypothetical protein